MRRRPRLTVADNQFGYYHVMSRTAGKLDLFGDREKEMFRRMIRRVAEFSGVRVLTHAVMSNHFHVFVQVPPKAPLADAELVRRYRVLYPEPTPWNPVGPDTLADELRRDSPAGRQLRCSLTRRMHDVSWFAKTLKQRFSIWFNQTHQRKGTLWSERFKSVLVQGDKFALRTVAAYIDLNAVRAGLVDDPKDYRFCGYAEAMAGNAQARDGLSVVDKSLAGYRMTLYGSGSATKDGKEQLPREEALKVMRSGGRVPVTTALRCRIRYFSEGLALGSNDFIEALRKDIHAPPKLSKPSPLQGADWQGLCAPGQLHKDIFR